MNKRFKRIALLLACLLALTGCSAIKGLEKDLQVILEVNGEYYDCVTVNSFNNAVVTEPQAAAGFVFKGWTAQESWDEAAADEVPVIANKGLVRYDDVKDDVKRGATSVTLQAVFTPIPRRDLVIAWYAKESTSGLNAEHMAVFQEKLYAYLTAQGYKPEEMDIVIRPYEGGVADTCAAISKDADVDITVGWSSTSNLTSTGGWTEGIDFVENVSGVTIGAKSRYTARISGTDLSLLVYAWIQNEFGQGVVPADAAAAPAATEAPAAPAPVVVDDGKLVIGWYAKTGTSGLDEATMARVEELLRAQLTAGGYTQELIIRPYDGVVADVQAAVLADGDVDLMIGMKAFALEGIEMEVEQELAMGDKTGRRIHRISHEEVAINVFAWLKAEAANGLFLAEYAGPATTLAPATQAAPAVVDDGKLVIGWYAKTGTSGLDEAIVATFEAALKAHLAANGFTQEVVLRPYDGVVADVQAAVLADGDVDLMIGMKKFAPEGIEMEVQENVTMGEKTDRRVHRISGEEIAVHVFEWLKTDEARSLFVAK